MYGPITALTVLRSYLGVVPGIVGHTGLNTVLKYLSPLVITLSCTTEPLIGACMGAPTPLYSTVGVDLAPWRALSVLTALCAGRVLHFGHDVSPQSIHIPWRRHHSSCYGHCDSSAAQEESGGSSCRDDVWLLLCQGAGT